LPLSISLFFEQYGVLPERRPPWSGAV